MTDPSALRKYHCNAHPPGGEAVWFTLWAATLTEAAEKAWQHFFGVKAPEARKRFYRGQCRTIKVEDGITAESRWVN